MEKKNVPKIRFPGFTEPWEQRKLFDVIIKIIDFRGRTPKKLGMDWSEDGYLALSALNVKNGYIDPKVEAHYGNQELYDKWMSGNELHEGQVLFTTEAPMGNVAQIPDSKKYILSQRTIAFEVNKNKISENYLSVVLRSPSVFNKLKSLSSGGTATGISQKSLSEIDIFMPINLEEQRKISHYFLNLDNLITLHHRKLENLKKQKKGLLQKMFPEKGKKVPEIRFPEFTNDWEQRKLGDYLIQYTEVTTKNNQYPVLTSSRKGIFFQKDYYDGNQIASQDNTGYNIVPFGYFTYRHMSDDEIFRFNINDIVENGIVSTLYPVFTTNDKLDSKYLQYQLNYGREFKRYAILQKQGGSRTYMYFNKLKELILTLPPSVEEQEKISNFFSKLDNLISLHQRKLEHLQKQKKALLQQMFV